MLTTSPESQENLNFPPKKNENVLWERIFPANFRTPKIMICSFILLGVLVLALLGPFWGPDPTWIDPESPTLPPGGMGHWMGTDDLGRDLFSRIAVGAQISLMIGLSTAVVAVLIGTLYGVVSAWFEGGVDDMMMRFIDVLYSLPGLMIVILFSIFLGRNLFSLVMALALFSWPDTARLIRGQVLSLKREEFVESFWSIGGGGFRLALTHFLPNLTGLIVLTATITIPRAILTESTLSFIGLGVEPPLSSWGTLASEGWQLVRVAPHMILIPAAFIFVTMVSLNLLGDALREVLDPKSS
ncbi:MAG: ABC transporter permease [Cyanobacteria bacterium]|nr:ABC transporter permease [Cyanobacteriota bacterium]